MPSKINAVIQPITASTNILDEKIKNLINSIEVLNINNNLLTSQSINNKIISNQALRIAKGHTPNRQEPTFIIAAHDSLHPERADYVCGGTNDNIEIQAAIDALPSVGGEILFTEGNYLSKQFLIPSNITLRGMGAGSKLKLKDTTNDRFIENSDRTGGNSNIVIENLYINGNKDGQSAIGSTDVYGNAGCLDFRNVTNLAVRNCTIINAWAAAIETTLSDYIFVDGNKIHNSADDGIGINDQSSYVTLSNNIITDAGQGKDYGAPCGIEMQDGTHDFTLIGNVIKNPLEDSIQVSTHTAGLLCYNGQIVGNTCEGGTIKIASSNAGQITYGIGIIGNIVNGYKSGTNAYHGISMSLNTKKCIASNNIVSNTTGTGIISRSPNSIINSNIIYDIVGVGLKLYNESTNCIASNNQIINCTTPFTDTGTNNKLFSNIGIVTENSGTATLVSGTTSIAVTHGLAVTPVAGDIIVTPIEAWGNMTQFYIDTYTSTQFTIHANINPGQDVDFAWKGVIL